MGVRKTESRIPAGYQASDFGQAAPSGDGRCALISYITSPLVIHRENTFVVLVADPGLASAAQTFEWSISENGGAASLQTTNSGEFAYTPAATGQVTVSVRLLDGANAEQAQIQLTQDIVETNTELEGLITAAQNDSGPSVSDPAVARELVNDHNLYYQGVTLTTPEATEDFHQLVFSVVYDGAQHRTPAERKQHLSALADSLNNRGANFGTLAGEEAGVSGVRLTLLAMIEPPSGTKLIDWTEFPEAASDRDLADQQLRQRLQALEEGARLDLFNIVRFPKSNITHCARLIERLRDQYFPGTTFSDVLAGMSGTRAQRIIQHYRQGPLSH